MTEWRQITLPLAPDRWGAMTLPLPLTPREWQQLLTLLDVMRPALVHAEPAPPDDTATAAPPEPTP